VSLSRFITTGHLGQNHASASGEGSFAITRPRQRRLTPDAREAPDASVTRRYSTAALLLAALALATLSVGTPAVAQAPTAIGVDANPKGNEPAKLGQIDSCVSVKNADTFDIDLFVRDVTDLLAWEVYVAYDPAIVEVVDRDVQLFLAANPGSSVLDVSARLPDRDGLYRAAAADTSDPPTPDSGSGILARLTLKAVGPGNSEVLIAARDVDGDGTPDIGPLLRDVDAMLLGDSDGDSFFDGTIQNAEIAVDRPCSGPPTGPDANGSSDEGGSSFPLAVLGAGAGAVGLIVLGLLIRTLVKRRRAS